MPDLRHYKDREQGFVKHTLIEEYLQTFAIKVGSKWDEIIYLDAFAGPWGNKSEDLSDTSFCIAIRRLKRGVGVVREVHRRTLRVRAFLIEKDPIAFAKLKQWAEQNEERDFQITCFNGEFQDEASKVAKALTSNRSFMFALIDPKGWAGLSMRVLAPLLHRRSAEVLVNVMTSFIGRFVHADNCKDSYTDFFGRSGVRRIIAQTPMDQRQEAVVREYCRSLKILCGFQHVSSCVVLQQDKRGIKYFMVFATNDPMGIKVFKEAEALAASIQDHIKYEKEFGDQKPLFATDEIRPVSRDLRRFYRDRAFQRVEQIFDTVSEVSYDRVFCRAMAMPLVTEIELIDFLKNHSRLQLILQGSRRTKPGIQKGDKVVLR